MTCVQKQFLYCMKAFMEGTAPNICITEDPADWQALFVLATQQMALPMVYGTTRALPGFQAQPEEFRQEVRRQTMGQTAAQIRRTQAFAAVYQELLIQGIRPVVVKGLVCRELYPTPEQRISGDEDLLLDPESFCCCVELLKQRGMELVSGGEMPEGDAALLDRKTGLYLELHPDRTTKQDVGNGGLERFFERAADRAIPLQCAGITVYTLPHTQHMLYLILHAFKHFLHSGFGVRQLCDMVQYANRYGKCIDWAEVARCCAQCRAQKFAAALLALGEQWLGLEPDRAGHPERALQCEKDAADLLQDLLESGAYGDSSMSRRHSGTLTLETVRNEKRGLMRTLFPPISAMRRKYPWLEQRPYLLWAAWGLRGAGYLREIRGKGKENGIGESLTIARQREKLLKKYGVLP